MGKYVLYGVVNYPTARRGDTGRHVEHLQRELNTTGCNCGAADGVFGAKTDAAVRRYQGMCGLAQDGIVGSLTWAALLHIHVVLLDPMEVRARLARTVGKGIGERNFVNANFFHTATIGWMASEGQILCERDQHRKFLGLYDKPKGTVIVKKSGDVDVGWKTDRQMDALRNDIYFCCQGFNLIPLDTKKEGFDINEVGRTCNAVMMGRNNGRMVIAVRQGANAQRSADTMRLLGCDKSHTIGQWRKYKLESGR